MFFNAYANSSNMSIPIRFCYSIALNVITVLAFKAFKTRISSPKMFQ